MRGSPNQHRVGELVSLVRDLLHLGPELPQPIGGKAVGGELIERPLDLPHTAGRKNPRRVGSRRARCGVRNGTGQPFHLRHGDYVRPNEREKPSEGIGGGSVTTPIFSS
jgi:hypothetical protein